MIQHNRKILQHKFLVKLSEDKSNIDGSRALKIYPSENTPNEEDITLTDSTSNEDSFQPLPNDDFFAKLGLSIAKMQMDLCEESKELKTSSKSLMDELKQFLKEIPKLEITFCINKIQLYTNKVEETLNNLKNLKKNREMVDLTKPGKNLKSIKELDNLLKETKDLTMALFDLNECFVDIENLGNIPFDSFDEIQIAGKLETITLNSDFPEKFNKYLSHFKINITKSIGNFQISLKNINNLYSVYKNHKYWIQLTNSLDLTMEPSKTTIQELVEIFKVNKSNITNEMGTIIEKMNSEKYLKEQFDYIRKKWENKSFLLTNFHGDESVFIYNYDNIFEDCSDSFTIINNCKLVKHFEYFELELKSIEKTITNIFSLSSNLKLTQEFVVRYFGFFHSESTEMNNNLFREHSQFRKITEYFTVVLNKIKITSNIVEFCANNFSIKTELDFLMKDFEFINNSVLQYLGVQRQKFGRFQFTGDDAMLEIFGSVTKPEMMMKHISKIFPNVKSLSYVMFPDKYQITTVICNNNEYLKLNQPLEISKNSSLSQIFLLFQKTIESTLYTNLKQNLSEFMRRGYEQLTDFDHNNCQWIQEIFSQNLLLLLQLLWTCSVESAILENRLSQLLLKYHRLLNKLANVSAHIISQNSLKSKLEILIFEAYYQRSVIEYLIDKKVKNLNHCCWREFLRFYWNSNEKVVIRVGFAELDYRWEIYGIAKDEYLVRTQLVDKCFLSLTDARRLNLGSLFYGPAGTGKTESVKHLARYLGQFVLVYNCGENFSEQSFKRILTGAAQIGAWVCFDEFNRMTHEAALMALDIIQKIQEKLRHINKKGLETNFISLLDNDMTVHKDTLVLLTMNLDYNGRFQLPHQIYNMFRSFAMTHPDTDTITNVLMQIQGFLHAEMLSKKLIYFFEECQKELSKQIHYDFCLRSLKSVIILAGEIYRESIKDNFVKGESLQLETTALMKSINICITPRLLRCHVDKFNALQTQILDSKGIPNCYNEAHELFGDLIKERFSFINNEFRMKIYQLHELTKYYDSIIIYGEAGVGKTFLWKALMELINWTNAASGTGSSSSSNPGISMNTSDRINSYIINPVLMSTDLLFGKFESFTNKWIDGFLPNIFRKMSPILDVKKSHDRLEVDTKRKIWLVFDSPISPDWVESLNSLLDNNRMLTLSNGERIEYPDQLRIFLETNSLELANDSTISRCAVLYLDKDCLPIDSLVTGAIHGLKLHHRLVVRKQQIIDEISPIVIEKVKNCLTNNDFFSYFLHYYKHNVQNQVMRYQAVRYVECFFQYLQNQLGFIIDFCKKDFSKADVIIQTILVKAIQFTVTSDLAQNNLVDIQVQIAHGLPKSQVLLDFDSDLSENSENAAEHDWLKMTPDLQSGDISGKLFDHISYSVDSQNKENEHPLRTISNRIYSDHSKWLVPTSETMKIQAYIDYAVKFHKPIIFCGPPGTGKSLSVMQYAESHPKVKLVCLNFNCETSPKQLIDLFDTHCQYDENPANSNLFLTNYEMKPKDNRFMTHLLFFLDEINIQQLNTYKIQKTSYLLRELFELHSFYHPTKRIQVQLSKSIVFIAACNPYSNESGGRIELAEQLLHKCQVVFINEPSRKSYKKIYTNLIRDKFSYKLIPKHLSDNLTDKSLNCYFKICDFLKQNKSLENKSYKFISNLTLRDFSRWVFGFSMNFSMATRNESEFNRIWSVTGYHIFGDRFSDEITKDFIGNVFQLNNKLVYAACLTEQFVESDEIEILEWDKIRDGLFDRLKNFHNQLFCTQQMMDYIMKIASSLCQKSHSQNLIIIGNEGIGKELCLILVSKLLDIKIIKIVPHNRLTMQVFDNHLKRAIKEAVFDAKKQIILIKHTSFTIANIIERMSPLLSNGDVSNLFEKEDYDNLLIKAKQNCPLKVSKSEDALSIIIKTKLKLVTIISRNMKESSNQIVNSHAFFNRCHVLWFKDWTKESMANAINTTLDRILVQLKVNEKSNELINCPGILTKYRTELLNTICDIHENMKIKLVNTDESDKVLFGSRFQQKHMQVVVEIDDAKLIWMLNIFERVILQFTEQSVENIRRVNEGINVLKDTITEINTLEKSFDKYKSELSKIETDSMKKLKTMQKDKELVEKLEQQVEKTHNTLQYQENLTSEKRQNLMEKIKIQEKELNEARRDLEKLQRKQIIELKSMRHPPEAVCLACQAICDLLEENVSDWRDILSVILRDNFVSRIFKFDIKLMKQETIQEMISKYLHNPKFTEQNVSRACLSIGPVVKWTKAQLSYADTYNKMLPLRQDFDTLNIQNNLQQQQMDQCTRDLSKLREKIKKYSREYGLLQEKIIEYRHQLNSIEKKTVNAKELLKILREPHQNWCDSLDESQFNPVNILISALAISAILTYCGHLSMRQKDEFLHILYNDHLHNYNQQYNESPEPLIIPSTLQLFAYSPLNSLSLQSILNSSSQHLSDSDKINLTILQQSPAACPLIIDSSGLAVEKLKPIVNMHELVYKRPVTITSFAALDFIGQLKSSLKHSSGIIIENAEMFDPVIYLLLNPPISQQEQEFRINIDNECVTVPVGFKTFLVSAVNKWKIPRDLSEYCSVICFNDASNELRHTLLHELCQRQYQQLSDQKESKFVHNHSVELILQSDHLNKLISAKEHELLKYLINHKAELLSDERHVLILKTMKTQLDDLLQQKNQLTDKLEAIRKLQLDFQQPIEVVENLTNNFHEINDWSKCYNISTSNIKKFIVGCLDDFCEKYTKNKPLDISCVNDLSFMLIQQCFYKFWSKLLQKDQIPFALTLSRISSELTNITPSNIMLWNCLVTIIIKPKSHTTLDNNPEYTNECNDQIQSNSELTGNSQPYVSSIDLAQILQLCKHNDFSSDAYQLFLSTFQSRDFEIKCRDLFQQIYKSNNINELLLLAIVTYAKIPQSKTNKLLSKLILLTLDINIDELNCVPYTEKLTNWLKKDHKHLKPLILSISDNFSMGHVMQYIKSEMAPQQIKIYRLPPRDFLDPKQLKLFLSKLTMENYSSHNTTMKSTQSAIVSSGIAASVVSKHQDHHANIWLIVEHLDLLLTRKIQQEIQSAQQFTTRFHNNFQMIYERNETIFNRRIRLVFTVDIEAKIPRDLLDMSIIMIAEYSSKYKLRLHENIHLLSKSVHHQKNLHQVLNFLLYFFHSVLQIKLNKMLLATYNTYPSTARICHLSDIDLECASNILSLSFKQELNQLNADSLVENTIEDETNDRIKINTKKVRRTLKSFVMKSIYGGRINDSKQIYVINKIFDTIFSMENPKVTNIIEIPDSVIVLPKCYTSSNIRKWITDLKINFKNICPKPIPTADGSVEIIRPN